MSAAPEPSADRAAIIGWQIFDSLDRAACPQASSASVLYALCDRLNEEAADEGSRLTYAIAAILSDGTTTFEAG